MTNFWFWLWLGVAVGLGILEVLGTTGFLLGAAAAGVLMAAIAWFFPELGVIFHLLAYAVLATIATLIYFKFFRDTDPAPDVDLHDKIGTMIDTEFNLQHTVPAGRPTRTFIHDTMWLVKGAVTMKKGTRVRVIGGDTRVVQIEPVS